MHPLGSLELNFQVGRGWGMGGMGRLLRAIEWFAWGAGVWFGIGTR